MRIETERLVIRDLERKDQKQLYKIVWQKNVVRFMRDWSENSPCPESFDEYVDWHQTQKDSTDVYECKRYAITLKNEDMLIGSVYVLREHRGKRYAQKALHLLLYYAFEELRMHKLITCVNMGNGPSAGMMRNAGCVVEGVLRDNMFYHGKYIDTVVMGLTEEEFREKMWNRKR